MKIKARTGISRKSLCVFFPLGILAGSLGFSLRASAQPYIETTIHSFNPVPVGGNPQASLIQASDGNLYGTTSSGGSNGAGTVFTISNPTTSPAESVIYNFTGASDGGTPYASLIQASDGSLYGTTLSGGSAGYGTVFKISNPMTSPTESVIYSFTGGSDGASPTASLIQGSDGNLYGTTLYGGPGGNGTVFKISNPTASPTESVIYTFTGGVDGASPSASVILASDGNFYGTTFFGGSSGWGTVFKISNPMISPTESVIYTFTGGSDGGAPSASVIEASDGNLYGTTSAGGGLGGWGTVFEISNPMTSPTESVIYSFTGGSDGGTPYASVILASDGNLYGTTASCGSGANGTAFKISNPTTTPAESVIYSFAGASDGAYPTASLIEASDGNLYGTTKAGGSSGYGTVFKISNPTTSPTEIVIYSFTGEIDGSSPEASLIQASDGNLYGTTHNGGSSGAGTVFKISNPLTSPTESVIYSFAGGSDGAYPFASVIQASDGNLYGTTYLGGSSSYGTVFRILNPTTSPVESIIYTFNGGADGGFPSSSLIQASDGNLYGTTEAGGSAGIGTVFRISSLATSPAESVIYSFTGGGDGSTPVASVIQAADGNLYGTTYYGGSGGNGAVFKISDPGGTPTESVIYSFTGGADGAYPYASVMLASDGNIYGTTNYGGSSNTGAVFKISNPTISPSESILFAFTGGTDGGFPQASLIQASDGNLYGVTTNGGSIGNGTVFRINLTNTPIESVIYSFAGSDGSYPNSSLIQASDGNLYGTTALGGTASAGVVFSIGRVCPLIILSPSALAPALVNVPYTQSVSGSGGSGPYSYSTSAGALPPGLSLDGSTGAISGTPTIVGASTFIVTTTDANGCTASRSFTVTVNAAAVRYYTIAPCRLVDTRRPPGTYGGPALQGSGAQRSFAVDGQCGVPAGAVAVSANVTVVGPSGGGDLRMFPAGTPAPTASVINFNTGSTRASNAIVPMVGNPVGSLTVQCDISGGSTNVLLDVNGYFQ
jgi:uncharacterized repeat protein (TIGR03803 family)